VKTKIPANRLGMYDDVRAILDAALQSGGGSLELPSYGKAVHWRQRAYKFRKLYAEILAQDKSLSMSPYDRLTLPKIEPPDCTVVINVREMVGTFTPNREPYSPVDMPVIGDDLLDAAKSIAKKIKEGGL
jgi:hypothetical protein